MMKYDYDLVVVGAGPCGSTAAEAAASSGIKTLLIDKKKEIGKPVHCTGLLSKRTINTLKVSKCPILNEIRGAYIYSPSNQRLTLGTGEIKAYVVDREIFDKELLNRAQSKGAEIWLEALALNIVKNTIKVKKKGIQNNISAETFISAHGAKYTKKDSLKFFPTSQKTLYGLQVTTTYRSPNPNFVEIFFGSQYSDCFFAWAVPIDKKFARLGLACSNFTLARKGLKNLLSNLNCTSSTAPIAGIIPIGPIKKTVKDNILLCGDAAAQAKPTSGGGVYTGTLCSQIAAETVVKYLRGKATLLEYEKKWREKIGNELEMGIKAHKLLAKLNDLQIDRLMTFLSKTNSIDLIKKIGDIDYPSSLIRKFL